MKQNLDLAERYPLTHSYTEIGEKIAGRKGKIIVDISIWLMQLSCCCSYLYFIAELMDKVISHYTDFDNHKDLYIMLLTIPALPVSWITTYTFLSYFVMVGISIAFVGLGSIMGYCSSVLRHNTGCDPAIGNCEITIINW
jgi:amino acid permease